MRVGLVIYGNLETLTGGYLYDRQLVEYLHRVGDHVDVISIPRRNYVLNLADNFSSSLLRRLRDLPIDILLQDELCHPSFVWLNRRLRRLVRYPIISIVHHLRCYEAHPAWQNLFYRWIERQYLASVGGFVFNSVTTRQAVARVLNRADPTNSIVAHPAGDRFAATITETEIAARANRPGALRILFVGNLIPRKGLHMLLDALARLPPDSWQLTVVGSPDFDANYAQTIYRQVAERHLSQVEFVGALEDGPLEIKYIESHLLVVPSDYEGFGIVYLEGMSFGLPAIATTSGAAHEIIDDGGNGFLISPNDVVALACRIDLLQRERGRLAQMGVEARRRFLSHPGWDESMRYIRDVLNNQSARAEGRA
ncbi:MAG: glycosyltransferase family 4 protein [Chloroflexi bacterium]|nr:glycosyltransferase family 4 protein [Chloroflexota bacterium]